MSYGVVSGLKREFRSSEGEKTLLRFLMQRWGIALEDLVTA